MSRRDDAHDAARKAANEWCEPFVTILSHPPYHAWLVIREAIVEEFLEMMKRDVPDFTYERGERACPAVWN